MSKTRGAARTERERGRTAVYQAQGKYAIRECLLLFLFRTANIMQAAGARDVAESIQGQNQSVTANPSPPRDRSIVGNFFFFFLGRRRAGVAGARAGAATPLLTSYRNQALDHVTFPHDTVSRKDPRLIE